MPRQSTDTVAVLGIDIGKNTFHHVGLDQRGAIVLRLKLSRRQLEARLANVPPCLVGMEACVGAHHLSRRLKALGHDARLMPAKYVRAYLKGNKNDFRDAEAIAEAVQRPTMRFVATKTAEQLDLQALLHRVRSRLVSERTAIANEIRAFLLDRGIAVAKGLNHLRAALPGILATRTGALSPRLLHIIEDLIADWRRLDQRLDNVSLRIEALAEEDAGCERLMTVPGVGPIISSATVAAIGTGHVFAKARAGLDDRITALAGDVLEANWPRDQDAVLMSYLLYCVSANSMDELLSAAWNALAPGGVLLIHDFVVDDIGAGPRNAALWMLHGLLSNADAVCLTRSVAENAIVRAGFRNAVVEPLIPGITSLITAQKP